MAGITLVGPNPGQPFDIQTQQAQLAQAQQLAYALLAKELGGDASPIVHTGGGNPFARDVVNLAPLGNVAGAYFTKQHIGDINTQQQDLANQLIQRYQQGISQMFSPTLPNGAPSVMGTQQPTMLQSAQTGLANADPRIQALAGSILANIAKGEEARQVTPPAIASMVRAGVDPYSIHTTPGIFNNPQMSQSDINNMALVDKLQTTSPEQQVTRVPLGAVAQGAAQAAAQGAPGAAPVGGPGAASAAPLGAPSPATPNAAAPAAASGVAVPASPQIPAQVADIKAQVENARNDQQQLHDFVTTDAQKYVDLIKLAQMAQIQGTTGSFGNELNTARMIASRIFGFSQENAAKITDFGTMMKMALTPAAHAGRQEVGGRYTQLEFMQFLKAGGATGDTPPQVAQNIFTDGLLNGLTAIENHRGNTIPTLASTPGIAGTPTGAALTSSLNTGVPSSIDLADKLIPQIEPPKGAQPLSITYDPSTRTWHNEYRANAQPPVGSAPAAPSLPGGFKLVQ